MPDITYEAWLNDPARAFLDELSDDERERVWRLIRILEIDPYVDGLAKIVIDLDGTTESVYKHPEFWIFYHLADHAFVAIDAIARAWFDPNWRPPELPPNLRL